VVEIRGTYNTVQNCLFKNALQYSLEAYKADHFVFKNNVFTQQQYGPTASGNGAAQIWATNGVIEGNTIQNSMDCGIKLRWVKDTSITNNIIDVSYSTWTDSQLQSYGHSPIYGCDGIVLYHGDGPTQNITISHNTITDSKKDKITSGILSSNDSTGLSRNDLVTENTIKWCTYGILDQFGDITQSNNTIIPR
jgi:parallel beta-helix repeat protein